MAETTEKKVEKNLITITGYLKENTLEQFVSKQGKNAIRGNLIIATGPFESHRVQFYVSETTSKDEPNAEYEKLLELLPSKTTTIASYLEENPDADYNEAILHVSKVWAAGTFDEYARNTDKGEISIIQLRGRRAGYKKSSGDKAFEPKTRFEVEIYISEMTPELDEKGDKTGRLNIIGLLPNYDLSVSKISFIAPADNGVADYISKNYAVSDTVRVNGKLVNVMHRVLAEEASETHFGEGARDQYNTTFVNERVIIGGEKFPIHEGTKGSITKTAVKTGLAKRLSKITANSTKAPAPKADFGKKEMAAAPEDEDIPF